MVPPYEAEQQEAVINVLKPGEPAPELILFMICVAYVACVVFCWFKQIGRRCCVCDGKQFVVCGGSV